MMNRILKLILIATTIGCSFSALAQNGEVDTMLTKDKDSEQILVSVQQMPAYPGGMQALVSYLSENIRYPDEAKKQNLEGRVIVQFVVSKTGKIGNIVLKRDIGSGCGAEAIRVVEAMPDWKPGKQDGEPVNVYFTLPISFRLGHNDLEQTTPPQSGIR